jgi:predicted AAA+ superfamily ATPase
MNWHSITGGFSLHYWRDGNNEVDFVLQRRGKVIALEIKTGIKASTGSMGVFKKQFNPHKILLIGNSGLPWQELLQINPVELF